MKILHHINTRILEYCIIIVVFVLPPIFSHAGSDFSGEKNIPSFLPLGALTVYAAAAVFLYLRSERRSKIFGISEAFSFKRILSLVYKMVVCYCALIVSALFWNYIAKITGKTELPPFNLPTTFNKRLLLFASAIVLASYEEMLFRFFLPERGLAIVKSIASAYEKPEQPVAVIAAELIPIVLFAFAHRYLGLYAVCNALCAAVILRFALYKKLHIAVLCAVHSAYNITIFIALNCMRS